MHLKGKEYLFKYIIRDSLYLNIRREKYSLYLNSNDVVSDYCFHLSTLWYDNLTDATTNRLRGIFIQACKNNCSKFEGGFFYIPQKKLLREYPRYEKYKKEYKGLLFDKRISMRKYLDKTKSSAFVFNTPSVLGCHGWKLGEYLCMGKAIISTPLTKLMHGEFISGIHYLQVTNATEIDTAVKLLLKDQHLRINLEKSAKQYFDQYLSPTSVMKRIYNAAFNK